MAKQLVGVVDLGTFAVRFSISSVHPKHGRILPCVFQDKAPVALFKGRGVPIEPEQIEETITLLLRFRSICDDYGVPPENVRVASNPQEAPNAEDLFSKVETTFGWPVVRLSQESESWVAVYGMASTYYCPRGVYIELLAAGMQLYWISFVDGQEEASSPIVIPYPSSITGNVTLESGAALVDEVRRVIEKLWTGRKEQPGPRYAYVSASGFFGLQDVLMTLLKDSPMPLADGLELEAARMREVAPLGSRTLDKNIANLVRVLGHALPPDTRVQYSRYNIRDGLLFQSLDPSVRRQDPLLVATLPYALPGAPKLAAELAKCLPASAPQLFSSRIIQVVANAAYIHSSYPRAMQSEAALTVGLTGVLSNTHGISHLDRALVGLILYNRWGGDLSPHYTGIRKKLIDGIIDRSLAWWALYIGLVLHLLGGAYPGAHVRPDIIQLHATPGAGGFKLHINIPPSLYGCNAVMSQRVRQLPARVDILSREFGRDAPNLSVYIT